MSLSCVIIAHSMMSSVAIHFDSVTAVAFPNSHIIRQFGDGVTRLSCIGMNGHLIAFTFVLEIN